MLSQSSVIADHWIITYRVRAWSQRGGDRETERGREGGRGRGRKRQREKGGGGTTVLAYVAPNYKYMVRVFGSDVSCFTTHSSSDVSTLRW